MQAPYDVLEGEIQRYMRETLPNQVRITTPQFNFGFGSVVLNDLYMLYSYLSPLLAFHSSLPASQTIPFTFS